MDSSKLNTFFAQYTSISLSVGLTSGYDLVIISEHVQCGQLYPLVIQILVGSRVGPEPGHQHGEPETPLQLCAHGRQQTTDTVTTPRNVCWQCRHLCSFS